MRLQSHLRLRTQKTNTYRVSQMKTGRPWAAFVEAVMDAVRAEACCYHDCTPIMAAVRAAESPHWPVAAGRMDFLSRWLETCRALNELVAAGRLTMTPLTAGVQKRYYRPAGV